MSSEPAPGATGLRRLLSGSVVVRLAVTSSALIVVSCALLGFVLVRRHLAAMEANLTMRGKIISAFLAHDAELGVLSGDRQELRKLGATALSQQDVRYCAFLDRDRSVLAEVGAITNPNVAPNGAPAGLEDYVEFQAPISMVSLPRRHEEVGFGFEATAATPPLLEQIGFATVRIAVAPMIAERRQVSATAIGFTAGVALLAVASALLLTLGPLKAVASAAELAAERAHVAELKTRFVAHASHEFRTPLAVITAAADVLRRYWGRMSAAQQTERLVKIQNSTRDMTELLENVLTFSHAENAKLERQPIDVLSFCREIAADLQSSGEQREVRCTADGLLESVSLDPKLFRQIVRNLVSNALKYSEGPVEVAIARLSGCIRMRVSDHGIGIGPEDQSGLFEPFHRGRNVGRTPGTGLGLSITHRAVVAHGGTITVESAPGRGTTFTVLLPNVEHGDRRGDVSARPA
jgi:signal transduction histidine kinase